MSPRRIQQRRTKGWRKPQGAVAVGRGTKWGNPWKVHKAEQWDAVRIEQGAHVQNLYLTPAMAVTLYRLWISHGHAFDEPRNHPSLDDVQELAGRDLMCWCPLVDADGNPVPCHADVLLEIANGADQ